MSIKRTVLTLLMCSWLSVFSGEYIKREFNESALLNLLDSGDSSVISIEKSGEVYLRADKILITENGIFVQTDSNERFQIPFLSSNTRGCYSLLTQSDSTVYPVISCKNCGVRFSPTFFNRGKCPRCGTQN